MNLRVKIGSKMALSGLFLSLLCCFNLSFAEVIINPQALSTEIEEATIESYKAQWPSEGAEWSVECLNLPTSPIHMKGDNLHKKIRFSNVTFNAAHNIAMLELSTTETSYRVGVAVKVKVTKMAWEVVNGLNAKQRITPNNLKLSRHEFNDLGRYVLGENLDFTMLRSRVNLLPHTILDSRNIEKIPSVSQNTNITLILEMPNDVQVKTQALALENGFLGDQVRVSRRTQNQHRILYTATVIQENTVQVKL